jgi:hypothetical protein
MNVGLVIATLLTLAVSTCDQMRHQPRYDYAEKTKLFADGTSLQAPPDGTVARDDPAWQAAPADRPAMSAALLARGRERYGIYCAVCHDAAGYGRGWPVLEYAITICALGPLFLLFFPPIRTGRLWLIALSLVVMVGKVVELAWLVLPTTANAGIGMAVRD